VDLTTQKLYFTDAEDRAIRRANVDGSAIELLVQTDPGPGTATCGGGSLSQPGRPAHIALDVAQGVMYWADPGLGALFRANLDGSGVTTLLTNANVPVYPPDVNGTAISGSLAVDPEGQALYFGTVGLVQDGQGCTVLTGNVMRANLDGSGVSVLSSQDAEILALAVDHERGMLYATVKAFNGPGGYVERVSLDGAVQQLFRQTTEPLGGIVLVSGQTPRLYWVEGSSIVRSVLGAQSVVEPVATGLDPAPQALATTAPAGLPTDLVLTKTANGDRAGPEVLYTLQVRNDGPGVAQDVVLEDETPAGVLRRYAVAVNQRVLSSSRPAVLPARRDAAARARISSRTAEDMSRWREMALALLKKLSG